MRLLSFPTFQCPTCFALYIFKITKDKTEIVLTHDDALIEPGECPNYGKSFNKSVADFLVEV